MKNRDNAGLILALGVLAPLFAFVDARWITPLGIGMAVLALAYLIVTRRRPPLVWIPFLLGLAMVVWAGISVIWSITPEDTLVSTGKLAGNLLMASTLSGLALGISDDGARTVRNALRYGYPVWLSLLTLEILLKGPLSFYFWGFHWWGYGPFWLIGSMTATVLLVWPWLLTVPERRRVAAGAFVFVLLAFLGYRASALTLVVAMLVALACAMFCHWAPKARYLLVAGLAAFVLTAPYVVENLIPAEKLGAISATPNSFVHRTYIWRFVAQQIEAHPVLGRGHNSARSLPGGKMRAVDPTRGDLGQMVPLHPHQSALQIWVELGAVGAVIFAAFLAWAVSVAGRTRERSSVIPLGQAMTVIVLGMGSYGVWQSWWLNTIVITTSITIALMRTNGDQRPA